MIELFVFVVNSRTFSVVRLCHFLCACDYMFCGVSVLFAGLFVLRWLRFCACAMLAYMVLRVVPEI